MEHIPVLFNEVISNLKIKGDGKYVDLTLGRAGHSSEILRALTTGHLYAFDQDIDAIKKSEITLKAISSNYSIYHTNFINMKDVLEKEGVYGKIDGILMDLGVSSPQLDKDIRGFSYRVDAPLDMRMDQRNSLDAATVVNTYPFEKLVKIFKEYGDEKYAASIARNIIKYRPISTTLALVDVIKKSKPMKELKKEGHPAKQVFQAIRIEVNDELNVLKSALKDIAYALKEGGRLLVISFHSGEDRIVKSFFKELCVVEGSRINIPTKTRDVEFNLLTRKPIEASEQELLANNRSHSAKLRIIERKEKM